MDYMGEEKATSITQMGKLCLAFSYKRGCPIQRSNRASLPKPTKAPVSLRLASERELPGAYRCHLRN